MAMSVRVTTLNGRIVHEIRHGVESFFLRDPQGSTIALADVKGNITDTYQYWPFGKVLSHVGGSATPFTFLGTLGYFTDFLAMYYVRARHLRAELARWLTVDPLWPRENAYGYCAGNPALQIDPSGLGCAKLPCTHCSDLIKVGTGGVEKIDQALIDLRKCLEKATTSEEIKACLSKFGGKITNQLWEMMRDYLACVIASVLARNNGIGLGGGCDPCKAGLEAPDTQWCCYEKFLACLFKCSGKEGAKLSLCIEGCNHGKRGMIDCGFAEAS